MRTIPNYYAQVSPRGVDQFRPFPPPGMQRMYGPRCMGRALPCPFRDPQGYAMALHGAALGLDIDPLNLTPDLTDPNTGLPVVAPSVPTMPGSTPPSSSVPFSNINPWVTLYQQVQSNPTFWGTTGNIIKYLYDNFECFVNLQTQQKYTDPPADCKDKWQTLFTKIITKEEDLEWLMEQEPFNPPSVWNSTVDKIVTKRATQNKPPLKPPAVAVKQQQAKGPGWLYYGAVAAAIAGGIWLISEDKARKRAARTQNRRRRKRRR